MARHSAVLPHVKHEILLMIYGASRLTLMDAAKAASERFNISISFSQVQRINQQFNYKYRRLLEKGMPPEVVLLNKAAIAAKGIEAVEKELTEKLLSTHTLYDYLNEGGNDAA